jgi:hypothetical protein
LQALALRDRRIYVLGTPVAPASPVRIFLDVESDPDAGYVYLIGLIVEERGSPTEYAFWADTKEQEQAIFAQFIAEATRRDDFVVFCYGGHERAVIQRLRKGAARQDLVDRVLDRLVNVLALVYAHLYFPTYSNGLKDIGRRLGFAWTDPEASGLQSIVWRARWEATRGEAWRQRLLTYNREDCAALRRVTDLVAAIAAGASSEGAALRGDAGHPSITTVDELARFSDYRTWKRVDFVHPDYEYVNSRGYFDYQRERVYVRADKPRRKRRAGKTPSPNRALPASEQTYIAAAHCPACGSERVRGGVTRRVRTQEPRVKRAFDLVATPTGVRRRVVEYRTTVHRCLVCGAEFVPHEHERLDKHFHGLKSWAMVHHVAYRLSLGTIARMIEDFFGVRVFPSELHMFKSLLARQYAATYQELQTRLLAGGLLHVDETEVRLQDGKGYVWVFTNLEEVVYLYRPTREGEFLRDLLRGFRAHRGRSAGGDGAIGAFWHAVRCGHVTACAGGRRWRAATQSINGPTK